MLKSSTAALIGWIALHENPGSTPDVVIDIGKFEFLDYTVIYLLPLPIVATCSVNYYYHIYWDNSALMVKDGYYPVAILNLMFVKHVV